MRVVHSALLLPGPIRHHEHPSNVELYFAAFLGMLIPKSRLPGIRPRAVVRVDNLEEILDFVWTVAMSENCRCCIHEGSQRDCSGFSCESHDASWRQMVLPNQ